MELKSSEIPVSPYCQCPRRSWLFLSCFLAVLAEPAPAQCFPWDLPALRWFVLLLEQGLSREGLLAAWRVLCKTGFHGLLSI